MAATAVARMRTHRSWNRWAPRLSAVAAVFDLSDAACAAHRQPGIEQARIVAVGVGQHEGGVRRPAQASRRQGDKRAERAERGRIQRALARLQAAVGHTHGKIDAALLHRVLAVIELVMRRLARCQARQTA